MDEAAAAAAAERQRKLQEIDLGTDRREYISTGGHISREKSLQYKRQLELSRRSNVPGSKEQRLAEKHKPALAAWSSIGVKADDTEDLEHLDPLMDGQLHRMKLTDELRGGSAHSQRLPDRSQRNYSAAAQRIPVFHDGEIQIPSASNRAPNRVVSAPATHSNGYPGKSSKHKPHAQPLQGLDPALDRNNTVNSAYNQSFAAPTNPPGRSAHTAPNPKVKVRRPLLNYPGVCSPEEFLKARDAMPGVDRRPLAQTPKAQVLPRAADRRAESSHLPPASPIAGKPQDQKDTTRPTAPTTAENGTGPVDRDLGTGSVSVEDTPPAASTNGDSKAKVKEELDSVPHGSVLNPQGSVPSPRPENPVGTLVDFDCAMDSGSAAAPSPALQELEGLRFTQSSELQSTQSSPSVSTEAKVDLEGTLHKDHPRLSELENQELYKEIAKITNLIKSLPLTNESLPALFALKEILETRLQTPLDQQEDTVQGQQLLTPPGPEHERSKTVASTKALETVSPVAESTPAHSRNTSYSGASTSPCQPRLNAQARQFKPNANPFSTHRSPSHATSDSSVSLPRSPSSEVTAPGSESVLSNGTAIPTIANTPWPEPVRNLINNNPLVYGHLYGDHLLPGQRSILPFAVTLTYSGTANSIYAPKVPNPSTPTFLKPPPTKPIKIVDPKTLVSRVSNRASSAQSAELAKESLTLKPRDAPVPAKKPQQTSLQESIYAPRYKDPKWL